MSDFLTRLLEVNRGETAVVTPRLPGLFASLPDTMPEESAETGLLQATSVEHSFDHASSDPVRNPGAEETPGLSPAPGAPEFPLETRQYPQEAESRNEPENQAEASGHPGSPLRVPDPQISGRHEVDILENHDAADKPLFRHENEAGQTALRPAENSPAKSGAGDIHPSALMVPDQGNEADFPPGQSPAPLLPVDSRRRAVRQQHYRQPPGVAEAPASAEPSIHVTIGRVEVRAQTAPPKPAPRPVAARERGGLSLQDYLKRGGSQGGSS